MTRTLGPRIYIKRDEESSIARGCQMYAAHFRPEIAIIPRIATAVAPFTCEEVWLTEAHRKIRDTRDLHEELCAFDITYHLTDDFRPTKVEYGMAVDRMSIFLGPDYDILAHGVGDNLHIHCEYEGGR